MKRNSGLKVIGAGMVLALGLPLLARAAKKPAAKKPPASAKPAPKKPPVNPDTGKPASNEGGGVPAAKPGQPTAGQQFKNIKVLKDLPADQLMPTMQAFNAALGVKCNFCHVAEDFASDNNPHKGVTREMVLMTQRLNAKEPSVNKQVRCFTCHRGEPEPSNSPEEAQRRQERRQQREGDTKTGEQE